MNHRYEANRGLVGNRYRGDADLDAFDRIADAVLEAGTYPLRFLDRLDAVGREQVERLVQRGLLARSQGGEYRVASAGLKRVEEQALRELLGGGRFARSGRHDPRTGASQGPPDGSGSRPYLEGDPLANLDLGETIRQVRQRQSGRLPLNLQAEDLVVQEAESGTQCHTVLLLDRSGSMALYSKFLFAKRLALGLQALIRRAFPEDRLTVIGFGTRAAELSESELLLARPYSVGLLDNRIAVRLARGESREEIPEHFTNLQAGLRMARKRLMGQGSNRQILCLTDGEPTAHESEGELVMAYPPTRETAEVTLREVGHCRDAGIAMSFFALIDSPLIGQLHAFVARMARVARGAAAYCSVGTSNRLVLEQFRAGRVARRFTR